MKAVQLQYEYRKRTEIATPGCQTTALTQNRCHSGQSHDYNPNTAVRQTRYLEI